MNASVARIVRARFFACGVVVGEKVPRMAFPISSSWWQPHECEAHFQQLTAAFLLASRCREALSKDDVRLLLCAALEYDTRCGVDAHHVAWCACQAAMRDFAAQVLQSSLAPAGRARHDAPSAMEVCKRPRCVIEAAVRAVGA